MTAWRDINEQIKLCRQSADPVACLQRLFEQYHDGHIAFYLGQEEQARGNLGAARDWYLEAEQRYPKEEFKARARAASEALAAQYPRSPEEASLRGSDSDATSADVRSGEVIRSEPSQVSADDVLYVIPCSKRKIWHRLEGAARFVPAQDAYTGDDVVAWLNSPLRQSVQRWLFLSGKYGFIEGGHPITCYDVTFSEPETSPISDGALIAQVRHEHRWHDSVPLRNFRIVRVLNEGEYLKRTRTAFQGVANVKPFTLSDNS